MLKWNALLAILGSLAGGLARGQPIAQWPAPASWSPAKAQGVAIPMDLTAPLPFIGLTPCRIADTRGNGFSGAYGPPALAAGSPRSFTLSGRCGIPAG
ncbi:MAG TPA: hypothetical protein VKE50_00285, partial [Thermoanaerobaculia bacterium]|nr:hypothetical protein [Thermoanaerobaculia bacterium]